MPLTIGLDLIAYIIRYILYDEMMWCLRHLSVDFGFVRITVIVLGAYLMDVKNNGGQGIMFHMIELHEIVNLPLRNVVLILIPSGLPPIVVAVLSLLELLLEMIKGCRVGET